MTFHRSMFHHTHRHRSFYKGCKEALFGTPFQRLIGDRTEGRCNISWSDLRASQRFYR